MEKLVESLNTQYPDSGWTIVIRGGFTDDDADPVMDAAIYTGHPHVAYSEKYSATPGTIAECINALEVDDMMTELYDDLNQIPNIRKW